MTVIMRNRALVIVGALVGAAVASAVLLAQASPEARRIFRSKQPIAKSILAGERHVELRRILMTEPVELGPDQSFVDALVEFNPIIFIGRVVRKEPEFLDFRDPQVSFTIVPMVEATWIGSRVTVAVERVIQTADGFPLSTGSRIVFVVDSDGTATIDGTKVDAETEMTWPVEAGKRYLITGGIKGIGIAGARFEASGLWLESFDGAPLRGPSRSPLPFDPARFETTPTFERDGAVPTDIYGVAARLEEAALKRRGPR